MYTLPDYSIWDVDYRRHSERTICCFEEEIRKPTDELEKYLNCSICYGLPRSVAMNIHCGHILCQPCCVALHKKENGGNCPVCRGNTAWKVYQTYEELDIIHRRLYLQFTEVKCGNACGFSGPVPRVVKHEREECPNRLILCCYKDCPFLGPAEFVNNEHRDNCEHARKVCNSCLTPQLVHGTHNCLEESIRERKRMFIINVNLLFIIVFY